MTYTPKSQSITVSYYITSSKPSPAFEVTDLDVVFDSALRFNSYVARIVNTSLRKLGVAWRACNRGVQNTCCLYEYYIVSWIRVCSMEGDTQTSSMRDERVPRKLTPILKHRYFGAKLSYSCYEDALNHINFLCLSQWRTKADLVLIF